MAHMHMQPLPPHVHHSTTRLTHKQAYAQLSAFLERAESDPAYRPDSTLTEHGPVSTSAGGQSNLTLHHLKRILQGMEGKKVGGLAEFMAGMEEDRKRGAEDVDLTDANQDADRPQKKRRKDEQVNGEVKVEGMEGIGWQDKEDFEQRQDDEVDAHNTDRDPGARLRQPGSPEEARKIMEIEIEATGEKVQPTEQDGEVPKLRKEERKRLKKERRKAEKQDKQKKKDNRDPD